MTQTRTKLVGALAVLLWCLAPAAMAASAGQDVLGGQAVEGSDDSTEPTELSPGVSSDTLGSPTSSDHVHYYSYRRTVDFSTVHVGVVAKGAEGQVTVSGYLDEETSCWSETVSYDYGWPDATFGTRIRFQPENAEDRNEECVRSDVVYFSIDRGQGTTGGEDLPIAITVVEERPTEPNSTADLPPAVTVAPSFEAPKAPGPTSEQDGGDSFDDAPLVDDGSYESSIVQGTEVFYRVRVGWGQSLAVTLETPDLTAQQVETVGYASPEVWVELIDPLRNSLAHGPEDLDPSISLTSEDRPAAAQAGVGPVRYLNRYDGVSSVFLPGEYWVSVRFKAPDDHQPLRIPYTLSVDVQGEESGKPTYDGGAPFLVADGHWSAEVSGLGEPAEAESHLVRNVAAGVLALLGIGCCAAGVLRLRS